MRPAGATMDISMSMRAVEQGARLVGVPSYGVLAVLQMPRGNLEAVNVRLLVLIAAAQVQTHGSVLFTVPWQCLPHSIIISCHCRHSESRAMRMHGTLSPSTVLT